MKKTCSTLILIICVWLNGFAQSKNELLGIWLGETVDNYIILLDFKKNGLLNVGHINNDEGLIDIVMDNGLWSLIQNNLDLTIANTTISLEILNFNKDSVVFNTQQPNNIQIKKLIRTVAVQKQQNKNLKFLLMHNIYKDKNGNTYDLNNQTIWYILNFNELFFITNQYCWFSNRVIYQFSHIEENNIQFKFYHNGLIGDLELISLEK